MEDERMKILKMIEQGIISAEEGAELLKATSDAQSHTQTGDSKKYGIRHFFDDAVEKIKNVDLDFKFGESVQFDTTMELEPGEIKDMDLWIANGSLKLVPTDQENVQAKYRVKVYQVQSEREAKERFRDDGEFSLQSGLLRLASPSKQVKADIELKVPNQSYEFIKAHLTNGHLESSSLKSHHLQIKTSNGKVELQDIRGESCKVETGHGAVSIRKADLETCHVETVHGEITLDGQIGKSEASAISGLVTVNHVGDRAYQGYYKASTGQVQVTVPSQKQINGVLRSHLGKLNCRLEDHVVLKQKDEFMNKLVEFEAFAEFENSFHLEAEAKTGSVTVNTGDKQFS
ncbi:DUF4097 family beta strand repeat-containing protein [Halobacillus litoralis]|uniref:DUF4097 family beta strand repeat-containing protein n=1 Tax=Halobacillus litoralis TaxID=45668 RepID=UPI001CD656DE|nr:DUF4097 family beta strand repeat-containing protein [Halobacillus litoralis]MCA0971627.1 DUF4097 family beta strand repeat-containing protein [Halobacillus litoralis]